MYMELQCLMMSLLMFTNFLGVERGRVARQEDEILAGVGQPALQWAPRCKSRAENLVDLKERSTEVTRVTLYCQVRYSRSRMSRCKSKAENLVDLKERSTEVTRVTIYCQVQPTVQWASRCKSKAEILVDLKERSTEVTRVTVYCQVRYSRSRTLVQGYSE